MENGHEAVGACLCGRVTIRAKRVDSHVGACHCAMCRKWGGGPLLAVDCGADVETQGMDNVNVYESSPWAERGFCSHCGTHLFYRLKESGQYIIPVGLFAGDERFVLEHQVFIDEKPSYYDFANDTRRETGAEVFAKYGSEQG